MGALTIAFDITIVGALALPWVVLVLHLLFFAGENRVGDVLRWIKDQQQPAAAGVLLFAVAYTMGSAVSRIAQDFFNDDDLFVHVHRYLFRMGMTENRILTSVYCKKDDSALLLAGTGNPALKEKIDSFQSQKSSGCGNDDGAPPPAAKANPAPRKAIRSYLSANPNCLCQQSLSWHVRPGISSDDDDFNAAAADIFGLEESALLLKADAYTQRLRQLCAARNLDPPCAGCWQWFLSHSCWWPPTLSGIIFANALPPTRLTWNSACSSSGWREHGCCGCPGRNRPTPGSRQPHPAGDGLCSRLSPLSLP